MYNDEPEEDGDGEANWFVIFCAGFALFFAGGLLIFSAFTGAA